MSRDMLSQDEIDALLKQNNLEETDDDTADGEILPDIDEILSPLEQDALGEIGNITFGSAATALSSLLGQKVDITTPQVGVISREAVQNEFPQPHVAVHVEYTEGFEGINLLVIQTRDAQIIADLMMGGDGTAPIEELSDLHLSAVQEAMNQMMGSAATSMSTIFNKLVNISPPGIDLLDVPQGQGVENFPQEEVLVKISFRLKVGDLIDSNIMQLIPVSFARAMVNMLLGGTDDAAQNAAIETPPASASPAQTPEPADNGAMAASPAQTEMGVPPSAPTAFPSGNDAAAYPQQPMYQQPMYQQPYPQQPVYQQPMYPPQQPQYAQAPSGFQQPPMNVQPVQFSSFDNGPGTQGTPQNLGMLMDIPLQVTVELGRTKRQIKDILDLSPGSIIELDKLAGEPVDILVNNKLIAKGEVVVIDENFGVRVTDIISQFDRVQKLQ